MADEKDLVEAGFRVDRDEALSALGDAADDLAHYVDAAVTLVGYYSRDDLERLLTAVNDTASKVLNDAPHAAS